MKFSRTLDSFSELLANEAMFPVILAVALLAAIFFIIGIIWFGMDISRQKQQSTVSAAKNEVTRTENKTDTSNVEAAGDAAVIAAITAAITAYYASNNPETGFRVVSFRRAGGIRPWNSK